MKPHIKETKIYRIYHSLPKDSVEYGIFEKIEEGKRVTIPVNVGWEDAGTWQLFYEAFASGAKPNVTEGSEVELIDSTNNLVIGPTKKMISIIGLSDIAVIDTPDGLLVSKLNQTGKVKDLFAKLEKESPEYIE
jgi:mannose-1-phosphate guanylyltransferase